MIESLAHLFDDLDVNRSGFLTESEIKEIPFLEENKNKVQKLLAYMDIDGSDAISKQEFVSVGKGVSFFSFLSVIDLCVMFFGRLHSLKSVLRGPQHY